MIYICIPTHNEQQTVGVVLWKLKQVLTDFPRDYQLLVADDASTDKTVEVLEPYTRVLPLTVIRSEQRQGRAASVEMLLREAVRRSEYPKRDAIITLQADFSEEPDDLVPLVKRLEAGADVAVGNKVSTSKETRARRFARSLARFFMRRQKWPEGVITPFDSYRAYRLYAVKRAIEERGTSRLLRYDGWAGNAELLRAVVPHARRVDVVDIDDRPDRLQRPRRERPFAAAMQVRVMAAGVEPERLVGVEELDRIALTTSRSRERAAITAQSIHAERGSSSRAGSSSSRSNGSRARQNGQRKEQGRTRSQSNGAARGSSSESRPRQERAQQSEGSARKAEARSGQARTKRSGAQRQPRDEATPASPAEETKPALESGAEGAAAPQGKAPDAVASDAVASDSTAHPKRKRRRRRRGGQGRSANAGQDQNTSPEADGSEAADMTAASGEHGDQSASSPEVRDRSVATAEAGDRTAAGAEAPGAPGAEGGTAEGTGAKKRRRRGGRRGGRGRRKPRPDGAAESGGEAGSEGSSSPAQHSEAPGGVESSAPDREAERPVAQPAARAEND